MQLYGLLLVSLFGGWGGYVLYCVPPVRGMFVGCHTLAGHRKVEFVLCGNLKRGYHYESGCLVCGAVELPRVVWVTRAGSDGRASRV